MGENSLTTRRSMKKIEKLAEEYVLKARAYYNDDEMRAQATCYTDGIRRGIELACSRALLHLSSPRSRDRWISSPELEY